MATIPLPGLPLKAPITMFCWKNIQKKRGILVIGFWYGKVAREFEAGLRNIELVLFVRKGSPVLCCVRCSLPLPHRAVQATHTHHVPLFRNISNVFPFVFCSRYEIYLIIQ
jgi:hypothetical protein